MEREAESHRRFRLVVALDTSEYAQTVLEHALDQASRHDAPDVNVVTVTNVQEPDFDETAERLRNQMHELLRSTLFTFGAASDWRITIHVRQGEPAEEIAALADEIQADLVVVGRFGMSAGRRRRHGSVVDDLLPLSPCPTLVVQIPYEDRGLYHGLMG